MLNLLIVDDDAVDLMTVKRGLTKAGVTHHLTEAANGVEALQLLRDGKVPASRRLVLLDLNMPRMNGLEFMRALRADPQLSSTPVVVLTTSTQEVDRREAHRLNCAGYFVKPLDFNVFVDLLQTIDRYWSNVQFAS